MYNRYTILLGTVLLVLIIPVILAQTVKAANVEDGGFSQGFRDGKSDGGADQ